jgi:hypothetical protein
MYEVLCLKKKVSSFIWEPTDKIQNENSSQLHYFSCFRFCVSDIKFSLKYLALQYLGNYTLLQDSHV